MWSGSDSPPTGVRWRGWRKSLPRSLPWKKLSTDRTGSCWCMSAAEAQAATRLSLVESASGRVCIPCSAGARPDRTGLQQPGQGQRIVRQLYLDCLRASSCVTDLVSLLHADQCFQVDYPLITHHSSSKTAPQIGKLHPPLVYAAS